MVAQPGDYSGTGSGGHPANPGPRMIVGRSMIESARKVRGPASAEGIDDDDLVAREVNPGQLVTPPARPVNGPGQLQPLVRRGALTPVRVGAAPIA
jgi:hypothetical protein